LIPFFEFPALQLPLGLKVDIFGVLSACGVALGASLAARAARKYGPGDDTPLRDVVPWAVGIGLLGGHFLHLFGYHPELLKNDFWVIFRVWEGLSSMGGVLGSLIGIFIFFRRIGKPVTPYLDALALGAAPGWAVARIGCFFVHDHPGVRTDFPLAVNFPVAGFGGPRHDLGLYDVFVLAGISAILYLAASRKPQQGRIMGLLAVGYAGCRFFLDFLRASDLGFVDARYLGLTPAQYIVMVIFGAGVWLLTKQSNPVVLTPMVEAVAPTKTDNVKSPKKTRKA
jgi:phosphatidylglycerol---prolipoprotein diacylglyceryl transferase